MTDQTPEEMHATKVAMLVEATVDALMDVHKSGEDASLILDAAFSVLVTLVVKFEAEHYLHEALPRILDTLVERTAGSVAAEETKH